MCGTAEVTQILARFEAGDPAATDELLPLVYDELRRLIRVQLAGENPGNTLQATALVHEAYLRLVRGAATDPWQSRGQFFRAAAECMRRILIDAARRKQTVKRGGDLRRIELAESMLPVRHSPEDLLALAEALASLLADGQGGSRRWVALPAPDTLREMQLATWVALGLQHDLAGRTERLPADQWRAFRDELRAHPPAPPFDSQ